MPIVITASDNLDAKQLSMVVFHKYSREKSVHSEGALRSDKGKTFDLNGVFPLVDSPRSCQTGQIMTNS